MTDPAPALETLPPFADMLGIRLEEDSEKGSLLVMPFDDDLLGRPGFLHGGAMASILEFAGRVALQRRLGDDDRPTIKPINVTIDFLRGGRDHDTHATAYVTRLGSRIANVTAEAWQVDRSKLIASARMTLQIVRN